MVHIWALSFEVHTFGLYGAQVASLQSLFSVFLAKKLHTNVRKREKQNMLFLESALIFCKSLKYIHRKNLAYTYLYSYLAMTFLNLAIKEPGFSFTICFCFCFEAKRNTFSVSLPISFVYFSLTHMDMLKICCFSVCVFFSLSSRRLILVNVFFYNIKKNVFLIDIFCLAVTNV